MTQSFEVVVYQTELVHNQKGLYVLWKTLIAFALTKSTCSPLERTFFYDHVPPDRHRELWEVNNKVHKRGMEIVKPGVRCSDVARDLNEIYLEHDMLQHK